MLITIEDKDGKLNVNLSEDMTWPNACLMLISTLHNLAKTTIANVVTNETPHLKKKTKKAIEELRTSVSEDVADHINFGISNILEDIAPKDPNLQLSEIAILTMENQIIHAAADKGISLEEALKEYEKNLLENSPYTPEALKKETK